MENLTLFETFPKYLLFKINYEEKYWVTFDSALWDLFGEIYYMSQKSWNLFIIEVFILKWKLNKKSPSMK